MSITLIIIIITVVVSIAAFNNGELLHKLILYPAQMQSPAEYYRFITSGFIHANWMHLGLNMFVLWIFGEYVETLYSGVLGKPFLYPVLYVMALVASGLPSFAKHKNNYYYRALGASGAVGAIVFSFVYYNPWATLYVWFIPMPAIVFAVLYLAYSYYASRRGNDNIGHDAHFYGSLFGFVFTLIFDPTHGQVFLQQITQPSFSL